MDLEDPKLVFMNYLGLRHKDQPIPKKEIWVYKRKITVKRPFDWQKETEESISDSTVKKPKVQKRVTKVTVTIKENEETVKEPVAAKAQKKKATANKRAKKNDDEDFKLKKTILKPTAQKKAKVLRKSAKTLAAIAKEDLKTIEDISKSVTKPINNHLVPSTISTSHLENAVASTSTPIPVVSTPIELVSTPMEVVSSPTPVVPQHYASSTLNYSLHLAATTFNYDSSTASMPIAVVSKPVVARSSTSKKIKSRTAPKTNSTFNYAKYLTALKPNNAPLKLEFENLAPVASMDFSSDVPLDLSTKRIGMTAVKALDFSNLPLDLSIKPITRPSMNGIASKLAAQTNGTASQTILKNKTNNARHKPTGRVGKKDKKIPANATNYEANFLMNPEVMALFRSCSSVAKLPAIPSPNML